ncbi:Uncharacterised protein [Serratia liquefaciens]|nr:Uncharacterised protein [Serratia liquefaciens]
MSAVVGPHQQAVGHVAGELAANAAAGADAYALVLHVEIGLIVNVLKAQRAGIERVFVGSGGAADHRAVKLGMFAHRQVKSALAGENARLLLHAVVIAVHLVFAQADAARTGHRTEGEAAASAGILLFGIVTIAVLLAFQQQIATHVGLDRFAGDLCADQVGIAPAGNVDLITGVNRGFGVAGAVALLVTLALVDAGGNAQPNTAGANTDTHAQRAALALVFTVQILGVFGGKQVHVTVGVQGDVLARLQLAALHQDVAVLALHAVAAGGNAQVIARRQAAALRGALPAVLSRGGRLGTVGNADPHHVVIGRIGALRLRQTRRLHRLYAAQRRLGTLQCRQATVVGGFRLLRGFYRSVQRTADRAGQCQCQTGFLLFNLVSLAVLILRLRHRHILAAQRHVLAGHQLGPGHRQVITGPQGDVAVYAADGAALIGQPLRGIRGFQAFGAVADADTPAAHQAGFFLLLEVQFAVAFGRAGDAKIVPCQ